MKTIKWQHGIDKTAMAMALEILALKPATAKSAK